MTDIVKVAKAVNVEGPGEQTSHAGPHKEPPPVHVCGLERLDDGEAKDEKY
jgi:hypothetical protein